MSLGRHFPESFRIEKLSSQFVPGCVIYLQCPFTTPPKPKFMLVGSTEPLLVLMINSEINDFIMSNTNLLACQVKIDHTSHPFLSHNSWANCVDALTAFKHDEIKNEIATDPSKVIKGILSESCVRDVIFATNISKTMIKGDKKLITEALNKTLADYGNIHSNF